MGKDIFRGPGVWERGFDVGQEVFLGAAVLAGAAGIAIGLPVALGLAVGSNELHNTIRANRLEGNKAIKDNEKK